MMRRLPFACRGLIPVALFGWLALPGCRGRSHPRAPASEGFPDAVPAGGERAHGRGEQAAPRPPKGERPAAESRAVRVQLKRQIGKALIYEGRFRREQKGRNSYVETGSFYLTFKTLDRTREGFNRVAIRRTFLDRSRKETLENKRVIDRLLPNTDTWVNLGPNCDYIGNQRCYAFDSRNNVAYHAEDLIRLKDGRFLRGVITARDENMVTIETTAEGRRMVARARIDSMQRVPTPHVLHYDTPHFFFPVFSKYPKAPGESWSYKIPVIVPLRQGGGNAVLPTQFDVRLAGRLRELRRGGGRAVAVVDYTVKGWFDSALRPFARRFSQAFREHTRIMHGIEGRGWVSVDLARGRILEKHEDFNIHLEAATKVRRAKGAGFKWDRNVSEISTRFQMKLLPPGTPLRKPFGGNGKVPPYD